MNDEYLLIIEQLQRENRELREEVNRLRKGLEEKESKSKDLQEEVNKQKEEIQELKEEIQKLRQTIFGLKASKKRRRKSNTNPKHKKGGPPFGHKGTSRKRPDRVDTTIVLELKECPYCGGELKELEDVRVRYEEEIIPVPLMWSNTSSSRDIASTVTRLFIQKSRRQSVIVTSASDSYFTSPT